MPGILETTLLLSVPLLLAAAGELVLERSGSLQIGMEGTMLTGAFVAFAIVHAGKSPGAGLWGAVAAGLLSGALFALFAIVLRADPILTGTAWNLLAAGSTAFGYELIAGKTGAVLELPSLPVVVMGLPWAGLAAFAFPVILHIFFSRTRPGLVLGAAGETPMAVRAQGYSVAGVRSLASLFSGALSGAGGAVLTLSISHTFVEGLTAGRGFLALGIVVFARWRPLALLPATLLVAGATALQYRLQAGGSTQIPYAVFIALPSLLSLAALAVATSRRGAPKALGTPAP
ncbi:MAG: ABC transporter permease [Acidobacteria bacterium]|nr:ABC transporter permease [Acidobacteriota bacterium]MCG3190960.1 hypothetical protein [Thermoanaerobaculia bacterium]